MFPVEVLTKELQSQQPISAMFSLVRYLIEKIMGWEGSIINVGSYFYNTL